MGELIVGILIFAFVFCSFPRLFVGDIKDTLPYVIESCYKLNEEGDLEYCIVCGWRIWNDLGVYPYRDVHEFWIAPGYFEPGDYVVQPEWEPELTYGENFWEDIIKTHD